MARDKAKDAAYHKAKYWADEATRERRKETAREYYRRKKLQVTPTETQAEPVVTSPIQV